MNRKITVLQNASSYKTTSISDISSSKCHKVHRLWNDFLQKRCHISFQIMWERWAELNEGPIMINFAATVQSAWNMKSLFAEASQPNKYSQRSQRSQRSRVWHRRSQTSAVMRCVTIKRSWELTTASSSMHYWAGLDACFIHACFDISQRARVNRHHFHSGRLHDSVYLIWFHLLLLSSAPSRRNAKGFRKNSNGVWFAALFLEESRSGLFFFRNVP